MSKPLDSIIEATMTLSRTIRQRVMRSGIGNEKMNLVQIHTLFLISEHAGLTMTELAKRLRISTPSATSLIDRLSEKNWIVRERDSVNRKLIHVKITSTGKAFLHSMKAERKKMMKDMFNLLPVSDQQELARILTKLSSLCQSAYQ